MKTMLKKTIALVSAIMCGASVLASCGGGKGTGDKITLRLWNKPTQDAEQHTIEIYNATMEKLEKRFPNINFESVIKPTGTDYRQEYDKALMAHNAPAFTEIFSYTDIPGRVENGTVADITKYVDGWDLKKNGKVLDSFDEAISKDGKWYALPYKAYTMGTLCNLKTLESVGVSKDDLPKTWDEFTSMGAEITDLSVPRIGYSLIGMDWCAWPFTAWVWSAGGDMVEKNSDGTYKLTFNSDAGVDAAMLMNNMIWKYKMTQKDILLGYNDIVNNVINGSSCFSFLGLGNLNQKKLDEHGLKMADYLDMPIPSKDNSIPRSALAGGEVIVFDPTLSEEDLSAAFEVVEYLYFSDEMMQFECDNIAKYHIVNVMIPGRVDWYEKRLKAVEGLTDEQIKALDAMRECARPEPYCNHWSDIKTDLVAPLQEIYLDQKITRERAKQLLDQCAEGLYTKYPDAFKK